MKKSALVHLKLQRIFWKFQQISKIRCWKIWWWILFGWLYASVPCFSISCDFSSSFNVIFRWCQIRFLPCGKFQWSFQLLNQFLKTLDKHNTKKHQNQKVKTTKTKMEHRICRNVKENNKKQKNKMLGWTHRICLSKKSHKLYWVKKYMPSKRAIQVCSTMQCHM